MWLIHGQNHMTGAMAYWLRAVEFSKVESSVLRTYILWLTTTCISTFRRSGVFLATSVYTQAHIQAHVETNIHRNKILKSYGDGGVWL